MATKKEIKENKVFSKPKAIITSYLSKTTLIINKKLYSWDGDVVYLLKILLVDLGFEVKVEYKQY